MNDMLNSQFSLAKDKPIYEYGVDELFLYDTILSEHNNVQIPCKMFKELVENILRGKLIPDAEEVFDRFILLNMIDMLKLDENAEADRSMFMKIKNEVESFLSSRNPFILDLIKEKGDFKDKIWGLNFLIEQYTPETGEHTEEVGIISKMLAKKLNAEHHSNINLRNFKEFGQFHDLGKLLIPPEILLKPGKLTPEEFDVIKRHSIYGSILIKIILFYSADKDLKETKDYADSIIKVALYHHKTPNGGYPSELSPENITIESEIVRIADVFHALMSQRSYKAGFDQEKVLRIIKEMEGTFRYPEVFDMFISNWSEFEELLKERGEFGQLFETVGYQSIDEDHKNIQSQLENIFDCQDCDIIHEYNILLDIIRSHFAHEEELMIRSGYPKYANHKKIHDELLIRTSFINHYDIHLISNSFVKRFVDVWLRKTYYFHSKTLDRKLSIFLQKNA